MSQIKLKRSYKKMSKRRAMEISGMINKDDDPESRAEQTVRFLHPDTDDPSDYYSIRLQYNKESAFVKRTSAEILSENRASAKTRNRIIFCVTVALFMSLISYAIFYFHHKHHESDVAQYYSDENHGWNFDLGSIREWCLGNKYNACNCDDPLTPLSGEEGSRSGWWMRAHEINKSIISNHTNDGLDVVFLGDSITERWIARRRGIFDPSLKKNLDSFQRIFTRDGGSDINSIALGISGDTGPNLLWRLQNGEMPDSLRPKIWWILIGINDLMFSMCSVEVVVMSILRVVEEILDKRKDDSMVVIGGLLPSSLKQNGNFDFITEATFTINNELSKFSNKHDRVYFYEPPLSLADKDKKQVSVELMPDVLHPNHFGYTTLGTSIKKVIDSIYSSS